jgi:coenzyme F420-0:L-glutamate ligase/coenzyme F420-1:gamma-L-glutamate ligase
MKILPVEGVPEVEPGDELAAVIEAVADPGDDDVLCVASTVVSKAEGRIAALEEFPPGPRAEEIADRLADLTGEEKDPRFAQAVLEESTEIIMEAPFLLTETRFGHIGVNAGIDRSNVSEGSILLLPERPTESARRIRANLETDPAVVVTDTCGRPFRYGQTAVAIGWGGTPASRDWRGETDREGFELEATVQAVVDELAGTANLLMGEGDGGTPAVLVRDWSFGDHEGSEDLFRDVEGDFVRQALRGWSYGE